MDKVRITSAIIILILLSTCAFPFWTQSAIAVDGGDPDIDVLPTSIDFGSVPVGSTSANWTVTVSNNGTANLTVSDNISIVGTNANQFLIVSDNCSGQTLPPSNNATLQVAFSPTSSGNQTATLSIPSNDPDESPFYVPLTGKAVLEEGLVAYYPFNGNANDESGNNNHGTVSGATLAADRFGNPNSAYSFDGVDDYVYVLGSSTLKYPGSGGWTLEAWTLAQSDGGIVCQSSQGVSARDPYNIRIDTEKALFRVDSVTSSDSIQTPISYGQWTHITGVYTGGNLKIYINGLLKGEKSTTIVPESSSEYPVIIGNVDLAWAPHGVYKGIIDEVAIYNRALTEDEILEHFCEGLTGPVIIPPTQAGSGVVGTNVTYDMRLINMTGSEDSFNLSVSDNTWTTSLSMGNTGNITDGGSVNFTVEVQIPALASPGDADTANITATSVTNPSMTDNATVTTTAVLEEGLVAYYPFNGNANDESGNNNHGIVNGATLAADRFGNENSAYSFDGVDDYVNVMNLPITDGVTLGAWVKAASFDSQDYMDPVVSQHGSGSGFELRVGDGHAVMIVTTGGVHSIADAGQVLAVNEWYHLAGTYDGNELKIYVNGVLKKATFVSGTITKYSGSLNIGRNSYWTNRLFNGAIDEVAIYNRALTEDEILEHFTVTLTASPVNIAANGTSISTLTAVVKDQFNNPVADGTNVMFNTDHGSLGSSNVTKQTSGGVATANLTSESSSETIIATVTATADSVSDATAVFFIPAGGEEVVESETEIVSGNGTMTNTPTGGDVSIDAIGDHNITTAKYAGNPGGTPSFNATGDYYDVHLDSSANVTSLTIEFCPAAPGTVIYYWNGASWQPCFGSGLTVTPPPVEVGGQVYPLNKLAILAPWIVLAAALILGGAVAVRRRRTQS